jgi:hypothetical protein
MKFLCIPCDHVMDFAERQLPGDGTLAAIFACASCGREIAMLTNPMETQLVSSLGVKIGGREVPEQPLELVRSSLAGGREDVFTDPERAASEGDGAAAGGSARGDASEPGTPAAVATADGRVSWTPDALDRLEKVPRFVRGMVKRIYADYAKENAIQAITPEVMDRARSDLGLEGM